MRVVARLARRAIRHGLRACTLGLFVAFLDPAHGQGGDAFYKALTEGDLVIARSGLQDALETRRSMDVAQWRNAASGTSGSIMPTRTFRIKNGFFCREYRETLLAAGTLIDRIGTACRAGNGVWVRVE